MSDIEAGQEVLVPCDVSPGAFSNEYLVTIDLPTGPISGFVNAEALMDVEGEVGYLQGVVKNIDPDTITIWINGSFFTTTGLAYFPSSWAKSHLKPQERA